MTTIHMLHGNRRVAILMLFRCLAVWLPGCDPLLAGCAEQTQLWWKDPCPGQPRGADTPGARHCLSRPLGHAGRLAGGRGGSSHCTARVFPHHPSLLIGTLQVDMARGSVVGQVGALISQDLCRHAGPGRQAEASA